jgi:hypothetical protein
MFLDTFRQSTAFGRDWTNVPDHCFPFRRLPKRYSGPLPLSAQSGQYRCSSPSPLLVVRLCTIRFEVKLDHGGAQWGVDEHTYALRG